MRAAALAISAAAAVLLSCHRGDPPGPPPPPTPPLDAGPSTPQLDVARPTAAALPAGSVTLTGSVCGAEAVVLELALDPQRPAGTLSYRGAPLTLLDPKLELVDVHVTGNVTRARYRLTFLVDECERAQPQPLGAGQLWDPCNYAADRPRPVRKVEGEVLLGRERNTAGGAVQDALNAVGARDAHSLTGAFTASGAVRP